MSAANRMPLEPLEPLVDARTAAECTKIPLAWLRTRVGREQRGVPYYRIGHLLRFRLTELIGWRDARAAIVRPVAGPGHDD